MTAPAAPKIDLWSSASFDGGHPREQYRWLRQHDPVHWHEEPGGRGFWAITRHEDVRAISRDSQTYSNSPTIMMQDVGPGGGGAGGNMMLMMDPPGHTRYRNLVKSGFTPRAVAPRAEAIARLAKQIVDEVIERGECDFVVDVAGKLPSYVIADVLGIPLEDGVMFYDWTEIIHSAPDAVPPAVRGETLGQDGPVRDGGRPAEAEAPRRRPLHAAAELGSGRRQADGAGLRLVLHLANGRRRRHDPQPRRRRDAASPRTPRPVRAAAPRTWKRCCRTRSRRCSAT